MPQEVADGLHDGSVLDGPGRAGGQKGREEEVVARRDDDDIVVLGVELLKERDGAPARAYFRISLASNAQCSKDSCCSRCSR